MRLTITARADDFLGARVSGATSDDAARLIAAAPELLAAARAVVEIGDKASMSNLCHAIAKAEGEN